MVDWTSWILCKNFEAKQEERLSKAYINNPSVPKGSCNCGAHKTGSHMHSDWCDGLKNPTAGKGYSFKHVGHQHQRQTDPSGAAPAGSWDHHSFHVYKDGKKIGDAHAVHESDDIDIEPSGITFDDGRQDQQSYDDVHDDFQRHINDNWQKYADMSPSYGKDITKSRKLPSQPLQYEKPDWKHQLKVAAAKADAMKQLHTKNPKVDWKRMVNLKPAREVVKVDSNGQWKLDK